ncbi:MAG TPA: CPBP family intramembrane glutamic endopeptidase [Candidatus Polarisedimenticolia bacterium]|nr:CPBP family intramembrane glutamic endopeptidase [Candidatus Polarisedimenticolia bacterium]
MSFDEHNTTPPREPLDFGGAAPSGEAEPNAGATPPEDAVVEQAPPAPAGPGVPEDLRVPWKWPDVLFLGVFTLAATIVLTLLVEGIFALCGVGPAQIRQSPRTQSYFALVAQALLLFALLGYLVAQVRIRARTPFWRTIGWRPIETGGRPRVVAYLGILGAGLVFAIVIEFASGLIGTKTKLPIEKLFQDRMAAILFILMAILIAPVIEETIFRGFIYPVIARRFGVATGIIGTGVLFGILHAPQLWGGWGQIVLLVIVGIVFTYARAVTGTVVASYLLHVSYNSFVSLAFFIASHGLRRFPPSP